MMPVNPYGQSRLRQLLGGVLKPQPTGMEPPRPPDIAAPFQLQPPGAVGRPALYGAGGPPAPPAPPAAPTPAPSGMVGGDSGHVPTSPFGGAVGNFGGPGLPRTTDPRQIQNRTARMFLGNARGANRYLWSALQQLINQGNTNRFSGEGQSAYLAPRLAALSDARQAGAGRLEQDLASRGLTDSSAMASGLGSLDAQMAQGGANSLLGLYNAEDERQRQAQEQARQLLQALVTGQGGQAAQIAGNVRQGDMYEQQMEGDPLSSVLGPLLGFAGTFAGSPGGMNFLQGLFKKRGGGSGGGLPWTGGDPGSYLPIA